MTTDIAQVWLDSASRMRANAEAIDSQILVLQDRKRMYIENADIAEERGAALRMNVPTEEQK